ncbi:hypothetical protein [Herbaspirillum sp. NPDC087042]|uniref:hypothetical protein n=1 Tax=Herbaspirillum sp. NPDC087042 TaxID=3364004 RepID=UPI0038106346
MAMESDLAIAARDVLPPTAPSQSGGDNAQGQALATAAAATAAAAAAASAVEEGVTLSLSAQGRLMAAFADAVDSVTAPVAQTTTSNTQAQDINTAMPLAGQPVTRATLFAIEARLVAARSGADAIARADSEVPPSNDPQRLQQARQATESLYGRAANPFAGLSRAELSAIVYDESGAYTVNERYAAANQRTALDQQFWTPVFQQALESGNWQPVISAALVFYATLSPLEQTAYPANYVQLLQQYLDLYQWQPQTPLPPQQQLDLAHMLETLVLPMGPLALAGGVIRGLVLPRPGPSLAELIAAAPRLADLIQIDNIAHSVQDSSYLVLLQRVFGVGRRDDEPAVARRAAPGVGNVDFLSAADRRYLAQAYGFARLHGMALEDVDALARDLARYRRQRADAGNAGVRGSVAGGNGGGVATASTTTISATTRMGSDDMATARRLLSGAAAHATTLDHAFLAWLLDPVNAIGEDGQGGRAVSLSALEKLLAGLAGMSIGGPQADATEPESVYRLALERIALQDLAADATRTRAASDTPTLTLAAQMAAQARSDAAEEAFMNNALMLLRMYRLSLKMSDTEQRTLAELVYSQLRKRRARPRRGKLFLAWATRSPWMPSLPA